MKKIYAILLCLGLSGCYVVDDGLYYDTAYSVPAASTYSYSTATYGYPATTVVYEQPIVTYYGGHHRSYRPRPHYSHFRHHPQRHHHAAPTHHATKKHSHDRHHGSHNMRH
ncbi:MAG: hypothetical protein IJ218_00115 [Alphaproteobacteria bacterium]|nr:hypothetical protein [Alphaproteobacteria bacterium]